MGYVSFMYRGLVSTEGKEVEVYHFTRLREDGGYEIFDPTDEGVDGEPPIFEYEGIVERFMLLAMTDPRIAVPVPVYEMYRALLDKNDGDSEH